MMEDRAVDKVVAQVSSLRMTESTRRNGHGNVLPIGNRRYSRLETCATPLCGAIRHWTRLWICSRVPAVQNVSKTGGQNHPAKAGNLPFEEALKKLESI